MLVQQLGKHVSSLPLFSLGLASGTVTTKGVVADVPSSEDEGSDAEWSLAMSKVKAMSSALRMAMALVARYIYNTKYKAAGRLSSP